MGAPRGDDDALAQLEDAIVVMRGGALDARLRPIRPPGGHGLPRGAVDRDVEGQPARSPERKPSSAAHGEGQTPRSTAPRCAGVPALAVEEKQHAVGGGLRNLGRIGSEQLRQMRRR